jgi:hypothetical protein
MRRVATAVLVILATASASAGTAVAAQPGLRIAGAVPLKLAGHDFRPHESVRVRVASGSRGSTRRVRAGSDGRFTVTFRAFAYHRCGADLQATARGSRGSFAALKRVFVECRQPSMPH